MYHASLAVQLPPDLPTPTDSVHRLVALLFPQPEEGDDDPHEQVRESVTMNLSIFDGLLRAFEAAGFDDVVAIVVDGKPAYVDKDERIGDLQCALEGLVKSRALAKGFAVMRTTFRRHHEGLELLAELRCHARSSARPDQTRVRISARPATHAPSEGEGPKEYAARIRELVRDTAQIEANLSSICAIRDEVGREIQARIRGAALETTAATVRFISPGSRQLGRMRHLGFGASLRQTVDCSLPSYERVGPYDDPLSRHYYSAYSDLFHWLAVGEALGGHVPLKSVEVLSATGHRLFYGDAADRFDPADFAVGRGVVRVSPRGQLKIDDSVPEVGALESVTLGSPHSRGWAGEAWADDIDEEG